MRVFSFYGCTILPRHVSSRRAMKFFLTKVLPFCLILSSCDSNRGASRDTQLEDTAETLEAKAEQVREDVKLNAEKKNQKAEKIREEGGDKSSAEVLDKDAEVTRKVGELRADQLEERAEKVRSQKE